MDLNNLEQLLQLLRREGVLRFKQGDLDVLLGPPVTVAPAAEASPPAAEDIDPDTGMTRSESELLFYSSGGA